MAGPIFITGMLAAAVWSAGSADAGPASSRNIDVAIRAFDAGRSGKGGAGPYRDLRRTEGCYVAVHLRNTLDNTGEWASVRLVPAGSAVADLHITGSIVRSDGKRLALEIHAVDASGRVWLDRRYTGRANAAAYFEAQPRDPPDPFQGVYDRIAEDLVKKRDGLTPEELERVRTVAELRFAADLAGGVFDPYLQRDGRGRYRVARLPSHDDPMMGRVARIRQHDRRLLDMLDEHYTSFYRRVYGLYHDWRMVSFDKQREIDRLLRESLWLQHRSRSDVEAAKPGDLDDLNDHIERMKTQAELRAAAERIHALLDELTLAFEAELNPLRIEVEQRVFRLSGSAETSYAEWRELLRDIFDSETGLAGKTPRPPSD